MLLHDRLKGYNLILASASPRRRELLAACDIDFTLAERFECEEQYPADLEAEKVAEYGYKQSKKGKRIAVVGFGNKLTVFAPRFFSRKFVATITAQTTKKED